MNYYGARQRESGGRWDYTRANRRSGTYAIGYCAGFRPLDATIVPAEMAQQENEWVEKHRAQYHTDGHATADEARACYKTYLLDRWEDDHARRGSHRWSGAQHQCKECKAWTQEFVEVTHVPIVLCTAHQTREVVAKHFSVGESISSY